MRNPTARPNILLITTDQQRADTLGVYGSPMGATPHLDALAAQGARFDQAFCQHPYCQPSRWTILTGQHPRTHGVWTNGVDPTPVQEREAFSARASRDGYRTAIIGKAHLATNLVVGPWKSPYMEAIPNSARMPDDWRGPYMGFDFAELLQLGHYPGGYGPWPLGLHYGRFLARDGWLESARRFFLAGRHAGLAPKPTAPETWNSALPLELHPTTWVADRAIDYLRDPARGDAPWFLWTSFADPHHPLDPPAPWCFRYKPEDVHPPRRDPAELDTKPPPQKRFSEGLPFLSYFNPPGGRLTERQLREMIAAYYGMVAQLDESIGRVLAALDASGMAGNTLVVFTVDHGELLGDHGLLFKGPFHYDGLLRVPMILRGEGIPAGVTVRDPVGTIDLVPTFEAYAGVARGETPVEGRSLLPTLAGDDPREFAISENDTRFPLFPLKVHVQTLIGHRYKLNRHVGESYGELYDRREDPEERVNLWGALPALRAELGAELDARLPPWRDRTPRRALGLGPA